MWSSERTRRRYLLERGAGLALVAGLAGCGFRPLHGGDAGGRVNPALAAIEVETPENRLGQTVRNQLLDALNPAGLDRRKDYRLVVRLERTTKALAIQLDDRTTRFDLTLAAFFRLYGRGEDKPRYRSAVRSVASFNVIREPFATHIAEQDAERRAAREVSRQMRSLLALHFAERDEAGSADEG